MDDTITRAILYGTHPPKGIYFTVRVEYNHEHPMFDGQMEQGQYLISNPIRTFPEALEASDMIVKQLQKDTFTNCEVVEVDPDETNGFHYYIIDPQRMSLAGVGIDTYDHRSETFH